MSFAARLWLRPMPYVMASLTLLPRSTAGSSNIQGFPAALPGLTATTYRVFSCGVFFFGILFLLYYYLMVIIGKIAIFCIYKCYYLEWHLLRPRFRWETAVISPSQRME